MAESTTNSVIRVYSEDTNNGQWLAPIGITSGSRCYMTCSLTQTNYNLPAEANFVFFVSGSNTTVTIPAGYYTQVQLVALLSSLLNVFFPGMTAQVLTYTNKIMISYSGIFSIIGSQCDQRLMDIIGFSRTATYTGALSYTGQTVGCGSYKDTSMTLMTQGLNRQGASNVSSHGYSGTTLLIPYVGFGYTNIYDPTVPTYFNLQAGTSISNLQFTFYDAYGSIIDFNGGSWIIEIHMLGSLNDTKEGRY